MRKLTRRVLAGLGLAIPLLVVGAPPSHAAPVTTELALVIDRSGSIGAPVFNQVKADYISVLNSVIPLNGTVVLAVVDFASNVILRRASTRINNAADLALVTNAINSINFTGGLTDIAGAITTAANELNGNAFNEKQIIDVSTDGFQTVAGNPQAAANAAVAGGIDQVNCLGVGNNANCNFTAGVGSFAINVPTFAQFRDALAGKIVRELPEPASLILFAIGLIGIGFMARRRRNTV